MRYAFVIILLLFQIVSVAAQYNAGTEKTEQLTSLPGIGAIRNIQFVGYLPVVSPNFSNLFFWFVESKTPTANTPIVLWLNGGPGASSLYGFFMENGPYVITSQGTLAPRKYTWTQHAAYLVIDQPAGVGFSFGTKKTFANEDEAMDQLYNALLTFFIRHPNLATRPLFLAGGSYAGKYLPKLATRILADEKKLPLKGIIIGNAWVNPILQQSANADFAYSHGLIDFQQQKKVTELYQQCAKEIYKKFPSSRRANEVCKQMQEYIRNASGNLNLANITTDKKVGDADMLRYLNRQDVRAALHIDSRVGRFNTFSKSVEDNLEIGVQDSAAELYPALLKAGVPVLFYAGVEDGKDCNFMGTDRWLNALHWHGHRDFAAAHTCIWRVNNEVAGYAKTYQGLTLVKVRGTGHLAPMDKPEQILELFGKFVQGEPIC
ncbi:peptidase S10 [soil metagenome]